MNSGQLGGNLGPFRDPASGQQVSGSLSGTFSYQTHGDPNTVLPRLQHGLITATNTVLSQKLAAGQLAIVTIAQSLPHFYGEIIAQSGAQALGVHIAQLNLQAQIAAPAAQQPYGQAPHQGALPPTPMQSLQNSAQQHAEEALDPSNYEVRARINVGGLRINASTEGGLDTDGLAAQIEDRAKSTLIWYAAAAIIGLLVLIGLAGLGWYIYAEAKSSSTPGKAPSGEAELTEWDGKKPFKCGGSDNIKIKGTTAKLKSGTAVTAGANCHLELIDVTINAPTALKALGNAKITVNGGSISGKTAAASALGSGQIIFKGTKVEGKTKALGSKAKITGP